MNRTLPGSAGDVALLLARLILGTIMFAHGYQKLFIDGIDVKPFPRDLGPGNRECRRRGAVEDIAFSTCAPTASGA
jgi:hypothetical protein